MDNRFSYSPLKIANVQAVQFDILSPEEIRRMSVREITHRGIGREGLCDPRLGCNVPGTRCETCSARQECPGHFGHLELARPMFHFGFMKTVIIIMRCVCFNCSKLLADEEEPLFKRALRIGNPKSRLNRIMEACKNRTICERGNPVEVGEQDPRESMRRIRGGCGAQQPKLTIEGMKIVAEYKSDDGEQLSGPSDQKKLLSAENVLIILKRISDEDCRLLGLDPKYARPDWMILQVLPIPKLPMRPSVMVDAFTQSEDDLTHQLSMIIRLNKNLKAQERKGSPPHIISEFELLLQFYIATYFDNDLPGLPKAMNRSGRPIKSICSKLREKGRIRSNLGIRVEFSAQTIITPDPNINIDELGVPSSIALNLTYPEIVTPDNILRLEDLVNNGPDPPPGEKGANYIIKNDGKIVDLSQFYADLSDLAVGYKVGRHLIDGDYVLLNRRPSLHKMSMMGHKIKIMPYSTFRLNPSVTSAYNAKFDWDEMKMFVPQSFESMAEVSELMMVSKCIISPQSHHPVIGVGEDTLLGSYKITQRDTFIEKDVFMNMLMLSESFDGRIPAPAILKPRPLWTGKQVFNLIIPKQINMLRFSSWHSTTEEGDVTPGDTEVRVEKGELLSGILCKKTLGTSTGNLIHVIWHEVGPDAAHTFVVNTQQLVNYWLLQHGFSIGIGDAIVDAATMENIDNTTNNAADLVEELIRAVDYEVLGAEPGLSVMDSFEIRVNKVLNEALCDAGFIAHKSLSKSNNLKAMVTAGSKGSFTNISLITACVGQQYVEGKRIPHGFINRTLPHFLEYVYGAEHRGFVENSYVRGLSPVEFFFNAMSARYGLIRDAENTCRTGYIKRQLVKAMDDIMVKYDGTVRNLLGHVIQFIYGEDGMDSTWLEWQNLESLKLKKSELYETYRYEIDDPNWKPTYLLPEYVKDLRTSEELRNALDAEVQKLEADRYLLGMEIATSGGNSWPLPVNIKRIITNSQNTFRVDLRQSDLCPTEIVEAVDKLQERLKVVKGDDFISLEAQKNATLFFSILLRSTLASKRVLKEYRLTREAFEWVVGEIESRFLQSLVVPGEMVGCISAQSICEPVTQMTLNAFHYDPIGTQNVTVGIPRLKEIINAANKIRNPSLSVYLTPEACKTKENANKVQLALEYTTLWSVTKALEIWYDPEPTSTKIEEDVDFVKSYYERPCKDIDLAKVSPWLLRLELNRNMMIDTRLIMSKIAEKINLEFRDDLTCIFSDDSADKLILHIRIMNDEAPNAELIDDSIEVIDDDVFLVKIVSNMLMGLCLQGIQGIRKALVKYVEVNKFDMDKGFEVKIEWMVITEGINLLAVMCHEDVDATKTTSNHLTEVIKVLGIEAVRRSLLDELHAIISSDRSYVNYRHFAMLCDAMTYRGHLTAITPCKFNLNNTGPMLRFSFEKTVDVLLDAAAFAETDYLRGVDEHTLFGQLAPIGTGYTALLLNENILKELKEAPEVPNYSDDESDQVRPPTPPPPKRKRKTTNTEGLLSPSTLWSLRPNILQPGKTLISPFNSPSSSGPSGYIPTSPTFNPSSPTYIPNLPNYKINITSPSYTVTTPEYRPLYRFFPISPVSRPSAPHSPDSLRPSPTGAPSTSSQYYSLNSNWPTYSLNAQLYSLPSQTYSPSRTTPPSVSLSPPPYSPLRPTSLSYLPFRPTSPPYSPLGPASPPYLPLRPTSPPYLPLGPTSPHYSPLGPTSPPYSPFRPTSLLDSPVTPTSIPTSSSAGDSPSSPGASPSSSSQQTHQANDEDK